MTISTKFNEFDNIYYIIDSENETKIQVELQATRWVITAFSKEDKDIAQFTINHQ